MSKGKKVKKNCDMCGRRFMDFIHCTVCWRCTKSHIHELSFVDETCQLTYMLANGMFWDDDLHFNGDRCEIVSGGYTDGQNRPVGAKAGDLCYC